MIRTVIIDDEERSREFLYNLLQKYCNGIEVIGQADGIESGIQLIEKTQPDLLFLDIQLREGTSFDILNRLSIDHFLVIFTTAYDEYAIKAFKFNAIDYLLKPVDLEDLKNAIDRAEKLILAKKQSVHPMLKQLLSFNAHDPTITVTSDQSIDFIRVFDIIRLESEGGYTTFYMSNGKKVVSSKHLKTYDEILSEYHFFRSHQSHMVNLKHVMKLIKIDGGSLELSDGSIVPISRRRKDQFLKFKR